MADDSNPIPLEPAEPTPPPPPPIHLLVRDKAPDLSTQDVPCVGCGYNLRGLKPDGRCPECGLEIERSLHGDDLLYSSAAYLDSLCRGIRLIFVVLILEIVFMFVAIVGGVTLAVTINPTLMDPGAWFVAVTVVIDAVLSVALVIGWWWFSVPDPSITGINKGDLARKFVRATVIITAVAGLMNSAGDLATVRPGSPLALLAIAFAVIAMLAWAISFFASMIYIRWIGRRIPSQRVVDNAGRLMWLGPLLVTVGALCMGLGPLVAFILYIILIYYVRQEIGEVKNKQALHYGLAAVP
ncbi:MAG: hypothetical protein JSV91_02900 [Phycisphaerales bacterium]|nr:MAG: hypothetical protein JSV91_02900 [Phycisphaerales bacterium]